MSRELGAGLRPPTEPAGFRLEPVDRAAAELARAAALATPAGHVDHQVWPTFDERTGYWERLLAGQTVGALVPAASAVLVGRGPVAGALIVNEMEAAWWPGGPWVSEVFVVPRFQRRGLGSLLLAHALAACAAAGRPRLGLTVTAGNPAERLYARLGFECFRMLWVLDWPGQPPSL